MPDNTIFKDRPDADERTSAVTIQKWGGLASFLMAVAFIVPSLIYLTGNLRDAIGPLTYALADFLYGPVWAASLVTAVFALRERIGERAPRRMTLALLAALVAAGAMVAVACIRSANRHYHLIHPELHLEIVHDGSRGVDHPRGGRDWDRMALPGVGVGAGRIGRLDIPPPSPCIERAVFGGRDCITVRVSAAGHRGDRRGAGRGGEYLAGNPAVESRAGRNASA